MTPPWPAVGVVVPTRDRPQQVRAAIDAIVAQDYPGPLRVVVVHDGTPPDLTLERSGDRLVIALGNARAPGLAGTRNTGILALGGDPDTDLVAFCDDDDVWLPGKLRAQVTALRERPAAELASCAVEVDYAGRRTPRLAGQSEVDIDMLARSRMSMLHSSTFLLRRGAVLGGLGLIDESTPGSHNEDWDLLLRAAKRHPVVHVDEPLVRIHWGGSLFTTQYDTKISSLRWMLDRHPEIAASRPGAARVYGQLACWHAAKGDRRGALRWAARALRARWREPRAAIALAATTGLITIPTILTTLHRHGRGL